MQCFGDAGEDILGMKGTDFYTNYHEQYDKMKTLRQTLLFRPLNITVRAKVDKGGYQRPED